MPTLNTYKFQFMASYVLSDYRSIQMLLQENFIQPLYDRLPFLSISLRSGSSASDAGGAGWDRRVVSEFEMSELGGSASLML